MVEEKYVVIVKNEIENVNDVFGTFDSREEVFEFLREYDLLGNGGRATIKILRSPKYLDFPY